MDVRAKRRCGRSVLPEADAKRDQLKIRLGAGGCVRMEEGKRGSGGREVLFAPTS
jgi:hypothetical protein